MLDFYVPVQALNPPGVGKTKRILAASVLVLLGRGQEGRHIATVGSEGGPGPRSMRCKLTDVCTAPTLSVSGTLSRLRETDGRFRRWKIA